MAPQGKLSTSSWKRKEATHTEETKGAGMTRPGTNSPSKKWGEQAGGECWS